MTCGERQWLAARRSGGGQADSETSWWTDEFIINPATGQYPGFRTVPTASRDGIKAGTIVGNSAVTTTVVGGPGQTG
jgi:hypothetical protein